MALEITGEAFKIDIHFGSKPSTQMPRLAHKQVTMVVLCKPSSVLTTHLPSMIHGFEENQHPANPIRRAEEYEDDDSFPNAKGLSIHQSSFGGDVIGSVGQASHVCNEI